MGQSKKGMGVVKGGGVGWGVNVGVERRTAKTN